MEAVLSDQKSLKIDEKSELIYTLLQPTRRKVLLLLLKSKHPLYIKKIADEVNASPRNTSFHLAKLASDGFVEWEFKSTESEGGRAGKFYTVSPKFVEKIQRLLDVKI